ncbi:MAG: MoxR family ATPase, partial [Actinomycetota bacterium]
ADPNWSAKVVELVRSTRIHGDVRIGSSVRGAIDMVSVAQTLGALRDLTPASPSVSLDAALVALSGRIRLREGSGRDADDIVRELWEAVFGRVADSEGDREGKVNAPTGATTSN